MKQNVFFRAGVGMILYREGKVAFFERTDEPGHWQFPQGGMYPAESPEECMWRELQEETGLVRNEIDTIHQVPFLTSYVYPRDVADSFSHTGSNYIGQSQFWFILHVKDGVTIDMKKASDPEFKDRKWIKPTEAINSVIEWKQKPYQQLIEYFNTHILK